MRPISKRRLALILAGLAPVGLLFAWQASRANPIPPSVALPAVGFGGFGGFENEEEVPPAPQTYVPAPMTEKAAKIWLKLQQPIAMNFKEETPFEDVIAYLKSATADEKDFPKGIPIYIDPPGIQEAEKTMQSPISIDLEGVPLAYSLRLALRQLDLSYRIEPEGLLFITYIGGCRESSDPMSLLLDEVLEARREIQQLRKDVADLKTALLARPAQAGAR